MSRYRLTPKRKAALRKAQLASARKRRKGISRKAKVAVGAAIVGGLAGAGVYRHKKSGSTLLVTKRFVGIHQPVYADAKVSGLHGTHVGTHRVVVGHRPASKTGLRISKNHISYRHRNSKGEKLIAYNHKPLLIGKKARGSSTKKSSGSTDPFNHVSNKGKADPVWSPVKPGDGGTPSRDHRVNNPRYQKHRNGYTFIPNWTTNSTVKHPLAQAIMRENGRKVNFS